MTVSFYVEQLDNINILRVTIYGELSSTVDQKVRLEDQRLYLDKEPLIDFRSLDYEVMAPRMQDITRLPKENDNLDTLEIKLHMRRERNHAMTLASDKEWWSDNDLGSIDTLTCRQCSTPLLQPEALQKRMNLPSEHYYELIECWICHEAKPEEHEERMRPILARKNTLLIGSTYFLVHRSNVLNIAVDSDVASKVDWDRGTMTKWILLNCEKCGEPVGEGQYQKAEATDAKQLMQAKLFKYSIAMTPTPKDMPVFTDIVVCELVDSIKAHAVSRFLIQGRKSKTTYALIWAFKADMTIMHGQDFGPTSRERVMKVLYASCANVKDDGEAWKARLETWSKDKQADCFIYPDNYCEQLLSALRKSTCLLPPSMRVMDHPHLPLTRNFSVGFITRLDY